MKRGPFPPRPVDGFDVERYMGLWYEIARIDNPAEFGISRVTARYTLLSDGTVEVLNQGYDEDGNLRERRGVATQCDDRTVGTFGVCFTPPYAAVYNVIAVDRAGYQWALVTTADRDHLWILSRRPTLDQGIIRSLLDRAERSGFDTSRLLWRDGRGG